MGSTHRKRAAGKTTLRRVAAAASIALEPLPPSSEDSEDDEKLQAKMADFIEKEYEFLVSVSSDDSAGPPASQPVVAMKSAARHMLITTQQQQQKTAPRQKKDKEVLLEGILETLEDEETKDRLLSIGDIVYAPFPLASSPCWYWGKITKKWRSPSKGFRYSYNIRFHDRDVIKNIGSQPMQRLAEYIRLVRAGWWESDKNKGKSKSNDHVPPKEYMEEFRRSEESSNPIPVEQRCKVCSQCKSRPDCGKCFICTKSSVSERRTGKLWCIQKMCTSLDITEKVQPCDGLLPHGFMYCFEAKDHNPEYDGLFIVQRSMMRSKPKCHQYRSFETAARTFRSHFAGFDQEAFYQEVGISVAAKPNRKKKDSGPWSLRQLEHIRCESCPNCHRERCGKCQSCAQDNGDCCLRKMCCDLEETSKAQAAPFFPPGWKFVFRPSIESSPIGPHERRLGGLVILAPNGRQYYSVEKAMKADPSLFAKLDVSPIPGFYTYAGIELNSDSPKKRHLIQARLPPKRQKMQKRVDYFELEEASESESESETSPRLPRATTAIPSEIQISDDLSIESTSNPSPSKTSTTPESRKPCPTEEVQWLASLVASRLQDMAKPVHEFVAILETAMAQPR